ncbi:RNA N6-adenosine-methyltransferase METTL16-like [Moschus berezovskii]|uniref:RNA N6-adenosine-methyltransferase METTL16-like n=1 Tax=Moschus berezovskii TaxID=68408 RepID=UPI0024449F0F|nr:RNA N6-adenosine-methyltransferase METTL16-like [Moschus berezovskii]
MSSLWEGGNQPFPSGHRELGALREEEERPSETAERSAPGSQERDRSPGRKKSLPRASGSSQDGALGCPALPEGRSATAGGHGPSQDSLSQEENPGPTEDERGEEKGDMEVLEGCTGSSNGAQDREAPEPFSSPVSDKR